MFTPILLSYSDSSSCAYRFVRKPHAAFERRSLAQSTYGDAMLAFRQIRSSLVYTSENMSQSHRAGSSMRRPSSVHQTAMSYTPHGHCGSFDALTAAPFNDATASTQIAAAMSHIRAIVVTAARFERLTLNVLGALAPYLYGCRRLHSNRVARLNDGVNHVFFVV